MLDNDDCDLSMIIQLSGWGVPSSKGVLRTAAYNSPTIMLGLPPLVCQLFEQITRLDFRFQFLC